MRRRRPAAALPDARTHDGSDGFAEPHAQRYGDRIAISDAD